MPSYQPSNIYIAHDCIVQYILLVVSAKGLHNQFICYLFTFYFTEYLVTMLFHFLANGISPDVSKSLAHLAIPVSKSEFDGGRGPRVAEYPTITSGTRFWISLMGTRNVASWESQKKWLFF